MTFKTVLFCLLVSFPLYGAGGNESLFRVQTGSITFSSEAPMELIRASSDQLLGILDISKGQFAFKVSIASFAGFNNPLQQEHFNENYLESDTYPVATYSGKIIEYVDYTKKGVHKVRTKGKLSIHGVAQERIIRSTIVVAPGKIEIKSAFTVLLPDHNIKIPRIVNNNLSKEIQVTVSAVLLPE